jgi:methionyl-tRNA formyltransferase
MNVIMSTNSEQPNGLPKVLLIGCGPTALSAFEALSERFHLVGLVRECQERDTDHDETIRRARAFRVPVHLKPTLRLIEKLIGEVNPDCVVVSSFSRVLPESLLARCRFVNVHYAPLPRYRGRANVNWAIINDEKFAGITVHTIIPGLDEGRVLFQQLIPIHDDHTIADLYEALNAIQQSELAEAVQRHLDGDEGVSQREQEASHGCSRNPEDGEIDWSRSAREVYNLVRALVAPYPGSFTYVDGKRVILWQVECLGNAPCYVGRIPGRVIAVSRSRGYVDVLAGTGVVRVHEVQREAEGRRPAPEVITSVRATLGLRTSDLLSRIERLEMIIKNYPQQGS